MGIEKHVLGVHFLDNDPRLSIAEREEIIDATLDLHEMGEPECELKTGTYEGKIVRGKYAAIGGISGLVYDANVETTKGRMHVSVIVNEHYHGAGARLSMN